MAINSGSQVLLTALGLNLLGLLLGALIGMDGGTATKLASRPDFLLEIWILVATFGSFVLLRKIIVGRQWKPWLIGLSVGLMSAPLAFYLKIYGSTAFGSSSAGFMLFGLLFLFPYIAICTAVGSLLASLHLRSPAILYVASALASVVILAITVLTTLIIGCSGGC